MAESRAGLEELARASVAAQESAGPLAEAVAIMEKLRGPGGCPWDREQTFDSIKRHTLEETYEVFDAIERRAWGDLRDELGDLLLQVLFYTEMAREAGHFTLADVAEGLNRKLVRRHPHIFPLAEGPDAGRLVEAADAGTVLRNWDQIKEQEKARAAAGAPEGTKSKTGLEDIPRTMPAMLEAAKVGSRAAKAGFDWPSVEGLFAKLEEEIAEVRQELPADGPQSTAETTKRVEEELGDVLFTVVNLARHLKVDTESALRGATGRFRRRFGWMEVAAGGFAALAERTPEELDAMWRAAKADAGDVGQGANAVTGEAV